ncbi:hypothetical protein PHYBOEH_002986 [Phytophthora boehmeriae]|uniref:Tudor domain-containing protein n=1 Tax=Phytophthora boehmeriae TaxID=109152 RepID=A0A8T1XAP3_9STRA|nr:hypothetical protein PHYBOEH_002986 [Phytophthora boehmeriae]
MAHVRVGKRVRVYWGDEEEWFEGAIQDYDEAQGVYVVYDDGDERWEPSNQRMEVLEEESDAVKDQEPANDARTESAGRPPEMMEPPASPGSAYDDDYEGMEQEEKTHDPNGIDDTDAESLPAAYDTRQTVDQLDEFERSYQQDHDVEEQTKQEAEHDEENEIIITDNVNNDPSDDEMSVAESEIPHIFEKRSASALGTRTAPSKDKARGAKRLAPAQTSSSAINRRRFEKKVATDNRSFAKRLEWKEGRRTRQVAEAKAQEKKKITPPQYGARKHGHKASSGINRSKYVQQVAKENKTIGKRLQNILGGDAATRNPADYSRWATAEAKDSTSYDYMDRDKAHVKDMRWQRQVELDFMMEKAQTKYQRQNQIVEEVMELQEFVAGLKSQVDALTKNVTRLNILNNKDQHVRDCLLRAAATSCGSIRKLSPRQPQTNSRGTKTKPSSVDNQEDSGSSGKVRKEQELELLMQHQERLIADKQKLSQELQSLNQQEIDLDKEINDRQAKWELAVATRLFHKQMEKKNALQAQRAAQEMMRRQKALELSREEEEQWVCYQAHQELTQLQIAIQLLRDQRGENPRRIAATRASSSSLSAVCDYLTKNIDKQKIKLKELGQEVERRRHDYEALLVNGGNEKLRKRVHELQKLVFLCKAQATHVKQAQRHAQRKSEQMELEFQRRIFNEQTETEIVFKKSQCL